MTGLLVGAAAGFLGALGLGGGTLLMMWMAFFEVIAPGAAAGVNLLAFLGGGLGPSAGMGLLGVLGGWALSGAVDEGLLSKGFAALLMAVGLRELLGSPGAGRTNRRKKRKAMVIRTGL